MVARHRKCDPQKTQTPHTNPRPHLQVILDNLRTTCDDLEMRAFRPLETRRKPEDPRKRTTWRIEMYKHYRAHLWIKDRFCVDVSGTFGTELEAYAAAVTFMQKHDIEEDSDIEIEISISHRFQRNQ